MLLSVFLIAYKCKNMNCKHLPPMILPARSVVTVQLAPSLLFRTIWSFLLFVWFFPEHKETWITRKREHTITPKSFFFWRSFSICSVCKTPSSLRSRRLLVGWGDVSRSVPLWSGRPPPALLLPFNGLLVPLCYSSDIVLMCLSDQSYRQHNIAGIESLWLHVVWF